MWKASISLVTSCIILVSSVHAFPDGAGGCATGGAAVAGSHLTRDPVSGSLSDGMVDILINNETIVSGTERAFTTQPGISYTIEARANGLGIRGVLFRLSSLDGTDLTGTLTAGVGLQNATVCANLMDDSVVGVTHTENSPKMMVHATFELDEPNVPLFLDVTVVIANNFNEGSIFYYAGFNITQANPPCDICGGMGKVVGNPDGLVVIPAGAVPQITESITYTCAEADEVTKEGLLPAEFCPQVETLAVNCTCMVVGTGCSAIEGASCGLPSDRPCCFPGYSCNFENNVCDEVSQLDIFAGRRDIKKDALLAVSERANRGNRRRLKGEPR